jgi:hypothetical protein
VQLGDHRQFEQIIPQEGGRQKQDFRENKRALANRPLRHTWSGSAGLLTMRGQQVRMSPGNVPFLFVGPMRG